MSILGVVRQVRVLASRSMHIIYFYLSHYSRVVLASRSMKSNRRSLKRKRDRGDGLLSRPSLITNCHYKTSHLTLHCIPCKRGSRLSFDFPPVPLTESSYQSESGSVLYY